MDVNHSWGCCRGLFWTFRMPVLAPHPCLAASQPMASPFPPPGLPPILFSEERAAARLSREIGGCGSTTTTWEGLRPLLLWLFSKLSLHSWFSLVTFGLGIGAAYAGAQPPVGSSLWAWAMCSCQSVGEHGVEWGGPGLGKECWDYSQSLVRLDWEDRVFEIKRKAHRTVRETLRYFVSWVEILLPFKRKLCIPFHVWTPGDPTHAWCLEELWSLSHIREKAIHFEMRCNKEPVPSPWK